MKLGNIVLMVVLYYFTSAEVSKASKSECLVYTTRDGAHELCITDGDTSQKTLFIKEKRGRMSLVAVDSDFDKQCIYFTLTSTAESHLEEYCFGKTDKFRIIRRSNSAMEGMALDWTTGNLYWLERGNRQLGVTSNDGRITKVLYRGDDLFDKPRGIAVHPGLGLLFWTDWSATNPRIVRASMDGNQTSVEVLIQGKDQLGWVNGITVDVEKNVVFWTDGKKGAIGSINIDGTDAKFINSSQRLSSHPFGVTVSSEFLYWTDWRNNWIGSVRRYRESTESKITVLHISRQYMMDISLFAPKPHVSISDKAGREKCHLWLLGYNEGNLPTGRCYCPDDYKTSEDPVQLSCYQTNTSSTNGTVTKPHTCKGSSIACQNGECIPQTWRCDGVNDCSDNSDEFNCSAVTKTHTCNGSSIACQNGECIPQTWRCDGVNDCSDNSDEFNCRAVTCNPRTQFTCGTSGRCIPIAWECDGEEDCEGGLDEAYCAQNGTATPDWSSPKACLIYTAGYEVRRVCYHNHTNEVLINDREIVKDVDVDYAQRCIFYVTSSGGSYSVKEYCLGKKWQRAYTVIDGAEGTVEGLAYDWRGQNLYWLNLFSKALMVSDRTGQYRATLYQGEIFDTPRDLVVDPRRGLLYWTDWSSTNPAVMRASMAGEPASVRAILKDKETVGWPNGLALDDKADQLYWIDAKFDKIMAADLDGRWTRTVRLLPSSPHPYGLAVGREFFFWSDWITDSIVATLKGSKTATVVTVVSKMNDLFGLAVMPEDTKDPEPCPWMCPHLCLFGHSEVYNTTTRTCRCADGYRLTQRRDGQDICTPETPEFARTGGNTTAATIGKNTTSASPAAAHRGYNITTASPTLSSTTAATTTTPPPVTCPQLKTTPSSEVPSFPFKIIRIEGKNYTEVTPTCHPLRLHRLCPLECFLQVSRQDDRYCFKCVCQ